MQKMTELERFPYMWLPEAACRLDEVIEELQNQFDEARELNVAVTVKPAVLQKIPLRIQIKPAEQYSFEQAKEICMQVVDDYFAQMHIGGIFRVAELL